MLIRRIGIDFGTSTTVFAYKDYDKKGNTSNNAPKLLELGGRVMFPSIVFEPEGEMPRVYGFDAEEESRIAEGALYANFKMDLMSEDSHDKACELIVGYFKYLRSIYKEDCNRIGIADEEETWLSYPASWPDSIQLEMGKMAQEAGFVNIHILDEPTAAINSVLYQYKDQLQDNKLLTLGEAANVLMIDMGAGTTDLVVCRFIPGDKNPVERLLSWPPADSDDYFGGREMDERLTEYCIDYCEAHNYYHRDFQRMKKRMSRNIKKWKEGEFFRALQTKRKPPVPEIVENNVPDVAEQKDFKIVDRKSFEDVLEGFLEIFPKIIDDCAKELQNGEDGFDLFTETDLVILTGGNSAWYFIDEYLLGKREAEIGNIGFSRLQEQPERLLRMGKPQQTVAYGLTLNEKIIKGISEQFKTKNSVKEQQIREKQVKEKQVKEKQVKEKQVKEKQVKEKQIKEKQNKVRNTDGKAILESKEKSDEIHYKKLKDLEPIVQLVNEAVIATSGTTEVKLNKGDNVKGALAGIGVTALGVLISPIASKAKKKQLHDEKVRLLEEIGRQLENVKRAKDLEKNVVDERKKLLDTLEMGLTKAAVELGSDLNAGK